MQVTLSAAETTQLKERIRAATDFCDKERLPVVWWATSGQHTLADMARLAGRARSTIQVGLADFTAGGLAQLLEREAPPGKVSPIAKAKVRTQLQAGLKVGKGRTAGQVAAWLKEAQAANGRPSRCITGWEKWVARSGFRVPATANGIRQPRRRFAPSWSKTLKSMSCPRIGR